MARLTLTTKVFVAATLAAVGLSSPAFAGSAIKIGSYPGGKPGVLQLGKNGTNFHQGTGRPPPLFKQGGFKPGSGGPGYGYKPGYGGSKWGYGGGWGYGAAAGVGLAAGLAGAALAAPSYDPPPDDVCYVIVRKYYLPDGTVRVRHIPRCD